MDEKVKIDYRKDYEPECTFCVDFRDTFVAAVAVGTAPRLRGEVRLATGTMNVGHNGLG